LLKLILKPLAAAAAAAAAAGLGGICTNTWQFMPS